MYMALAEMCMVLYELYVHNVGGSRRPVEGSRRDAEGSRGAVAL